MKNINKIVCLILALTMCMGLAVTAFAGGLQDFPDAEEVTYPEQLDLMVSIGIIDGINGELKPKGTVTREQAAKMIAYMRLGKEAADTLPKNSVVFGDVEKGRWSAGYKTYKLHKVDGTDVFGRPYTVWELNNKPMGQKQYKEAAKSLAEEISSGELYTALGREYAGDAKCYVNGEEMSDFPIVRNGAEKIGGRGIQTFVYTDEDTKAVTLVSIPTYLGVVTKVSGKELTVMVCDGSRNEEANMSGSYAYDLKSGETFAKNDRVLVCTANDEIQGIKAAENFHGVLEASSENYHKVDGKTYYKAATFGWLEYAEYAGD